MDSKNSILYILLVLFWGAAISTTQIVIFREYMCVSGGNELALGIALSIWLFSNAVGALVWTRRRRDIRGGVYLVMAAGLFFSLLSVLFLRYVRTIFGLSIGVIPDFRILLLSGILSVMPAALISGFSFPYLCNLFRGVREVLRVGFIYAVESFGLVLGYFATTVFVNIKLQHMVIILLLYSFCILIGLINSARYRFIRAGVFIVVALILTCGIRYLDDFSLRDSFESSFGGFSYLSHRDTNYNRYIVARRGEEYSLFVNNQFSKTIADEYNSKIFSHLAMTIADGRGRVLVSGEASYDILRHISEHRLSGIDYIEYDRELSSFLRESIKDIHSELSGIDIINDDARRFIHNSQSKYGVIIIDIPEPVSLQLNRYFTLEFFEDARRALSVDGILIFSLPSVASQPSDPKRDFIVSVYRAARSVFSNIRALAAERIYIFASNGTINTNLEDLIIRFRTYNISCSFEPELMSLALDEDNNRKITNILESIDLEPNRDKSPYALFSSLVLYEMSSSQKGISLLSHIKWIKVYHIGIVLVLITLLVIFIGKKKKYIFNGILMYAQGFISMSLEIVIVYLFQIECGMLYHYMAMLFALFMLGLGTGSLFFDHYRFSPLVLPIANIFLSALLLIFNLDLISYCVLLFINGLITGLFFGILSSRLISSDENSVLFSASVMDFSDSFGAMLSALFIPIVSLPLFYFANTLILLILISFMGVIMTIMTNLSKR